MPREHPMHFPILRRAATASISITVRAIIPSTLLPGQANNPEDRQIGGTRGLRDAHLNDSAVRYLGNLLNESQSDEMLQTGLESFDHACLLAVDTR